MEGFDAILSEIDFLWPLMQRTADAYRWRTRVCELLPFGSVGEVADDVRRSPKDIDVLFVGKNTPHRTKVLQMMAKKGGGSAHRSPFSKWLAGAAIVESMLDRAKIGLNLTLHGLEDDEIGVDPRFASCQRVTDMLSRDICVVSEEIPFDNPYAEFMVWLRRLRRLPIIAGNISLAGRGARTGASSAAEFHAAMDVQKVCQAGY